MKSLHHTLINPETKRLRSGWRVILFLAVLLLPRLLLADAFAGSGGGGEAERSFEVSFGMIVTYCMLAGWVAFVSWLCLRFLEGLGPETLGYDFRQGWAREFLTGCGIGLGMICLAATIQAAGGGSSAAPNPLWWRSGSLDLAGLRVVSSEVALSLLLFAVAASFEELLYRGYAFQTLLRDVPAAVPVLLLSLLFGLGHWSNPNRTLFSTVNTVLAGIWLSLAYLKTRRLWFPTALHLTWNWAMGAVFGIPVSGLLVPRNPLLLTGAGGPVWLTGGSYGSEGGISATIALAASMLLIARMKPLSDPGGTATGQVDGDSNH